MQVSHRYDADLGRFKVRPRNPDQDTSERFPRTLATGRGMIAALVWPDSASGIGEGRGLGVLAAGGRGLVVPTARLELHSRI